MRNKDTVAVTVTLPRVLYEATQKLAVKRECGNVSAVVRRSLEKEAGVFLPLELHDGAVEKIQEAEARTVKYSRRKKGQAAK